MNTISFCPHRVTQVMQNFSVGRACRIDNTIPKLYCINDNDYGGQNKKLYIVAFSEVLFTVIYKCDE